MKTHPFLPSLVAAAALLAAGTASAQTSLSIAFADTVSSLDPQLNNHAGDRSLGK